MEEFIDNNRNNIIASDNNEMVVECKNSQCQIVTQAFALKTGYQQDKSQDLKL
ncbi:MAG TPA: hypothetical protein VE593_00060 [Nitrososphaeraceae archaeon]|nr:hypothetical protein [Nitrososphaeraceae archaeon]